MTELLAFAEVHGAALFGRGQREALDALESRHDELLRALDGDPTTGIRIASAIWRFWLLRGHLREGRERLVPIVADANDARGWTTLGIIHFFEGHAADAENCARRAVELAGDDEWVSAFAATLFGWAAQAAGRYDAAKVHFNNALAVFRAMKHEWGEAVSLLNLGEIARSEGDDEAAEKFYRADLEIYRRLDERSAIAATLCNLGFIRMHRRAPDAAELFTEALEICREVGNRQFVPGILVGLAGVASNEGDFTSAARLIGTADAELQAISGEYEPADRIERDAILEAIRKGAPESLAAGEATSPPVSRH